MRLLFLEHFGDTERAVVFDPLWRTEVVVGLTAGIYAERAFDLLPILGDALQDAGCQDEEILAHCYGQGQHVRGCWVVDAILSHYR